MDIYDKSFLVTDPDGTLRRKRPNTDLLCDFCCGPLGESCWTSPCGEMELPLVMDPTGLPACSDDPWACCHACRPYVEAKDWPGLAGRSVRIQLGLTDMEMQEFIRECPVFMAKSLVEIIAHFERFDAARNGESYEEHAPYDQH